MKVTVGDITVEFDGGEEDSALDFIHALQDDEKRKHKRREHSQRMKEAKTKVEGTSGLNQIQYRTWEFLCESDCNNGIHVSSVARAFGITNAAANTRLIVLEKMGYAKRVQRGYYRALTPENG
jgi:DNA-binding MarR family transcriptional regulator